MYQLIYGVFLKIIGHFFIKQNQCHIFTVKGIGSIHPSSIHPSTHIERHWVQGMMTGTMKCIKKGKILFQPRRHTASTQELTIFSFRSAEKLIEDDSEFSRK